MNFPTEIGFERYASQPPSRMRSSSPFMAKAVTAMTGMARSSGSSLSHLVTSRPGDLRQLDIHQDQVRPMLAGEVQGLDAVPGADRGVAMRLQEILEELHVQLVVFDDQYGLAHQSYRLPAAARRWSTMIVRRRACKGYGPHRDFQHGKRSSFHRRCHADVGRLAVHSNVLRKGKRMRRKPGYPPTEAAETIAILALDAILREDESEWAASWR